MTDAITQQWIRGPADERAVANGCTFDAARGEYAVNWIQTYCRLYEGDWAGQPLTLMPWARDATMQLFGWVRWSEKWKRMIRRFRQASIWVPKKNGKSPVLAAIGIYLLCGDGEQGQKVFLAAKDGTQARQIAGAHALEMVRQSEELVGECSINLNLHRITHRATRSFMQPLSSSNSRTQESKEGLNGSILVDEVHVVDREFINRISRAGISRSEPLHIEVSTAGNNPDGYGRERFDHARRVEKGEVEDQELFVAIYAAPQDLADADLDADPLKYGRMANPAMGHTVDEEEYLADYQRSKVEMRKLADFKMYRLNIWQHAANPWINGADWARCQEEFTEDDFAGQDCVGGLDLSKTSDMTSFVLAFKRDELVYLLPYFWLPEAKAKKLGHLLPIAQWVRDGLVKLTPGDVVDYQIVKADIGALAEKFRITEFAYDPWNAEQFTQDLEREYGLARVEFRQTLANFTAASKEFERLIIKGDVRHNGNRVMTWQVGHVTVYADANQNLRPEKPDKSDHKKIDGVVAAIEALGRGMEIWQQGVPTVSFI